MCPFFYFLFLIGVKKMSSIVHPKRLKGAKPDPASSMYRYECTSFSKGIYNSLPSLLQFLSPFFTALMAASTVEVPIFTETNLGTRIAMAVPPDITARDFKSEQN